MHVPDLDKYTVYRKTSSGVTPIPGNFLANDPDTLLTDSNCSNQCAVLHRYCDRHPSEPGPEVERGFGRGDDERGHLPPIASLTVLQNHPNRLQEKLHSRSDCRRRVTCAWKSTMWPDIAFAVF